MKALKYFLVFSIFCSCLSKDQKSKNFSILNKDSNQSLNKVQQTSIKNDWLERDGQNIAFEKTIYLKIDQIYTGKIYNNYKSPMFFRVLVIPEEENIMLIAEKISIGEEGGNYKLVIRIRLTDDNSTLPKFGLNNIDSLRFIDSVTIQGYFNNKKMIINLEKLKNYKSTK